MKGVQRAPGTQGSARTWKLFLLSSLQSALSERQETERAGDSILHAPRMWRSASRAEEAGRSVTHGGCSGSLLLSRSPPPILLGLGHTWEG